MSLSSGERDLRVVVDAVAEHGVDDVAVASSERDEGLLMGLSFRPFAVVVAARRRVT